MSDTTAPKPRTPLVGRPFIARHTATLGDTKLILLGNAARLAHADMQLMSAQQGLDGLVPMNPRELNIGLQLDGGIPEVVEVVEALCAIGKLVDSEEDGYWYMTDWPNTQADLGNSTSRPKKSKVSAFRRYHGAGAAAHPANATAGCMWCAAGVPSPCTNAQLDDLEAPSPTDVPTAPTAPASDVQGALDVNVPAAPAKRTMNAALAEFREAIPADLAAFDSSFEGYIALLGAADEFADLLGDLSKNPRGALRNEVLAHALRNLVNEDITQAGVNRASSAAKALGADGHKWWVHAVVLRAGQPYNDEKHCLNDLTKVAREERSKGVAA